MTTQETTPATTAATTQAADLDAPDPSGLDALELTLAPIAGDSFLAEHWERRPLHVERAEPGRFDHLLSIEDAERLVCSTAIRVPAFRLAKDGRQIPLATYTEDVSWRPGRFSQTARVDRVGAEYAQGATVILQALQLHWQPVALYCRELEAAFEWAAQANAYLTPASAQGFSVHHDTHDVFVLQVSGQKRWRVYEPLIELPLAGQRWSPEIGQVGEPIAEITVQPGDTLFIPRGWPHEAAAGEVDSLHLTVGLRPPTRVQALHDALDRRAAEDVEFRRSLAADGVVPLALLERLEEELRPEAVARAARRRFVDRRRPILDQQLSHIRELERLAARDPVERRPTVIADLELTDESALLRFEGKELVLPARAHAAIAAALSAAGPFAAADLPGPLGEDGRLVLVRRLVREGFLRPRGA